jgi:hypothetical protein
MGRLKSHQARTVAATIEAQRLVDEREHERETRIVTLQSGTIKSYWERFTVLYI